MRVPGSSIIFISRFHFDFGDRQLLRRSRRNLGVVRGAVAAWAKDVLVRFSRNRESGPRVRTHSGLTPLSVQLSPVVSGEGRAVSDQNMFATARRMCISRVFLYLRRCSLFLQQQKLPNRALTYSSLPSRRLSEWGSLRFQVLTVLPIRPTVLFPYFERL